MAEQNTPAGWYDDGTGTGTQRYWDGQVWTAHVTPPPPVAPIEQKKRRSKAPWIVGAAAAVVVLLVGGVAVAWGPVSAALNPTAKLSDSEYYRIAIGNLESLRSADIPAIDFPNFDNARRSPGFRAAINEFVDAELARIDGEMTFDSVADRDEYAYSTLYAGAVDLEDQLRRGGVGLSLATQSFPQADEIIALEQQIASIPVEPGADGTYWQTADSIAAVVGSTITQDTSLDTCIDFKPIEEVAAYFCAKEPSWDYIFFVPAGVARQNDPALVDITKHEIAHKLIQAQCDGAFHSLDATWNKRYGEGVTNSYAVRYLGAIAENLTQKDDYAMTPETDAKARALHDGDLGCYDGDVLPTS